MHNAGWGWWVLSSVGMVAVWSLVIYGVVLLFRSAGGERPPAIEPESPQDILKRRLAAGEIDVDEYELLRDALADDASRQPREPALGSTPGARQASPSP